MTQYPDDKSTIFSIAPFGGDEFKPGLYPGRFIIPPCTDDRSPSRLVVGCSEHLLSIGGRKQPVRVTTPSFQIAASIVNDFLNAQLYKEDGAGPGICWLQGDVSLQEFLLKHKDKLQKMQEAQRNWFVLLVKGTEDDWNKYHNSRVVSDYARFAVKALELATPEWMAIDEFGKAATKCPGCGSVVDPLAAWCSTCIQGGVKVIINEVAAKTVKLG